MTQKIICEKLYVQIGMANFLAKHKVKTNKIKQIKLGLKKKKQNEKNL